MCWSIFYSHLWKVQRRLLCCDLLYQSCNNICCQWVPFFNIPHFRCAIHSWAGIHSESLLFLFGNLRIIIRLLFIMLFSLLYISSLGLIFYPDSMWVSRPVSPNVISVISAKFQSYYYYYIHIYTINSVTLLCFFVSVSDACIAGAGCALLPNISAVLILGAGRFHAISKEPLEDPTITGIQHS